MGIEGGYGWGTQGQSLIFPFNAQRQKCVDGEGHDCSGFIANDKEFQFFNNHAPNPAVALGDIHEHGGLIGYFYGWQKQFGNWVAGFEADFDFADIKGSATGSNSTFHSFTTPGCLATFDTGCDPISKTNNVHMDARVSALASARAKFGWVPTPDWLIYGTAGLGIAHVKESVSQSASVRFCDEGFSAGVCSAGLASAAPTVLGPPTPRLITGTTSNSFTGDDTMLGWAAGADIDWKYRGAGGSAWVFAVEYLHYGFPTRSITVVSTSGPSTSMNIGIKEDIDVIKGRISYFWPLYQ
jgi:opacity protein-like surface antigen